MGMVHIQSRLDGNNDDALRCNLIFLSFENDAAAAFRVLQPRVSQILLWRRCASRREHYDCVMTRICVVVYLILVPLPRQPFFN